MHIKKTKNSFEQIYNFIKKLFLIILFGFSLYLIYINRDEIIEITQSKKYQYGEIISFDGRVIGLEGHNILVQSINNKKYIIKSTVVDIGRLKGKNKFVGNIIGYDNGIYILDIKNVKQISEDGDLGYIYNKNMQIYIQIPSNSDIAKNYTIENKQNIITFKNKKTNIEQISISLFDCSNCKNKNATLDFVNNAKLSFVKVSESDRLIHKNNTYLPVKIKSDDQFLLYKLSQYIQFTDSDRVYNYINQNISNICNNNIDYITNIDEFTTKYQNNQKFIIIKGITKNRSKYICQIKLSDDNDKFDASLVNFYKLE